MKTAFIADLHIWNHPYEGGPVISGLNERASICLDVLGDALYLAREEGCREVIYLGDIFHQANPNPQLVAKTMSIMKHYTELLHVLLVGNHDQISDQKDDHALGPLYCMNAKYASHVILCDETKVDDRFVIVPFKHGPAEKWLPEELENIKDEITDGRILCIHLGIWDENTDVFMKKVHDAVSIDLLRELALKYRFAGIFAGNWHKHKLWRMQYHDTGINMPICQIGTLCPVNFSDHGWNDVGGMAIFDWETASLQMHAIPGPRFVKVFTLDDLKKFISVKVHNNIIRYIRAKLPLNEIERAKKLVYDYENIKVELLPDRTEAEAEANRAGAAAKNAENTDSAFNKYLDKFPVQEPGTKQGMVEKFQKYRKLAVSAT